MCLSQAGFAKTNWCSATGAGGLGCATASAAVLIHRPYRSRATRRPGGCASRHLATPLKFMPGGPGLIIKPKSREGWPRLRDNRGGYSDASPLPESRYKKLGQLCLKASGNAAKPCVCLESLV